MARHIQKELFDYIDSRLISNGAAQDAIQTKNARALVGYAADTLVGIREVGGNNRGKLVGLMQSTVGLVTSGGDGAAWCMSGVQSVVAYVEEKLSIKSRLPEGEHCLTVLEEAPEALYVQTFPLPNAIIFWQHGSTPNGHTGFFKEASVDQTHMRTWECNTEAGLVGGTIERDGGGCYIVPKRSMTADGTMHVKRFLKPF